MKTSRPRGIAAQKAYSRSRERYLAGRAASRRKRAQRKREKANADRNRIVVAALADYSRRLRKRQARARKRGPVKHAFVLEPSRNQPIVITSKHHGARRYGNDGERRVGRHYREGSKRKWRGYVIAYIVGHCSCGWAKKGPVEKSVWRRLHKGSFSRKERFAA